MHIDAIVAGLAGNPALPPGLVLRLVRYRRGFGEVATRADLTGDAIEAIIATDDHWMLHSLALNRHLPDTVRSRLAEHPDGAVRAALVVSGRGTPRELYLRLVDDPDRRVREYLAAHDDVPADVRGRLARDPDPDVRATLAQWWTDAPEEVRRSLLTDPVDAVRGAACSTYFRRLPHPVPPADLVAGLLEDPVTRAGAVRHADLTSAMAWRLAGDPDGDVREALAGHPWLPADVRDRLGDDREPEVRIAVFARQDTPEPLRRRIHEQALGFRCKVGLWMLELPWVTADPLPHVDSPYPCFRAAAAAAGASLPAHVVHRLLHDDDSAVRTAMAFRAPHLVDAAAAERIDRDYRPVKRTADRPADWLTFPQATLRRLATDPDPRMRRLAPRDPDLPPDLAARLAADPEPVVRRSVAGHPRLPAATLIGLLADESAWVAEAAAGSPALSPAEMDRLLIAAGL
ncbi:hypothetical protein [Dactylosporangium sp. NPDC005555]|uniref:hypothetical protein n=1 Tax=Dactylosporangium sp. NPDC005555 TaxID=3154889 RepID=UPI0033BB6279